MKPLVYAALFAIFAAPLVFHAARRRFSIPERFELAVVPFCCVVLAPLALDRFGVGVGDYWSAARLAPTFALVEGYRLYYPPDSGPILNTIYTPLYAFAYLPAALAPGPTGALVVAVAIAVAAVFGPAWALLAAGRGAGTPDAADAGRASRALAAVGSALLFADATLRDPALVSSAFAVHADAPAIGFALAGALALAGGEVLSPKRAAWAGVFAVLAPGAKQTTFPVVLAFALWAWLRGGKPALRAYSIAALATGFACFLFVAIFLGLREALFNFVAIPSRHPWTSDLRDLFEARIPEGAVGAKIAILIAAAEEFARQRPGVVAGAIAAAAAAFAFRRRGAPAPFPAWAGALATALALLPFGLLGRVKIGGYYNCHSPAACFALLAGLLALRDAERDAPSRAAPAIRAIRPALLLLLSLSNAYRVFVSPGADLAVAHWRHNQTARAVEYLRSHPGRAYFPMHPLAHLMAEGKLYHFGYGIFDRELAGFAVSADHLAAHVPPDATAVAELAEHRAIGSRLPGFAPGDPLPTLGELKTWRRTGEEKSAGKTGSAPRFRDRQVPPAPSPRPGSSSLAGGASSHRDDSP